jgi:hypothetical protein
VKTFRNHLQDEVDEGRASVCRMRSLNHFSSAISNLVAVVKFMAAINVSEVKLYVDF